MNIVFDFGRVVFTWQPEPLVEKHFRDPQVCELILKSTFEHPDWEEIDCGALTFQGMALRAAERTGLAYDKILSMVEEAPDIILPIPETVEMIRQLKKRGHKIYALSNMGETSMIYLENHNPFLTLFDGKMISYQVQMLKPDPAIFQHLIKTFNLIPAQTLFIDDHLPNIVSAQSLGFQTIHFTNPSECKKELAALAIL